MAASTTNKVKTALTERLRLVEPEFYLERPAAGRVSGSVVSDAFRGLNHVERQRRIWDALEVEFGKDARHRIGTLLAYTKAEWNIPLEGDKTIKEIKRRARSA